MGEDFLRAGSFNGLQQFVHLELSMELPDNAYLLTIRQAGIPGVSDKVLVFPEKAPGMVVGITRTKNSERLISAAVESRAVSNSQIAIELAPCIASVTLRNNASALIGRALANSPFLINQGYP